MNPPMNPPHEPPMNPLNIKIVLISYSLDPADFEVRGGNLTHKKNPYFLEPKLQSFDTTLGKHKT